MDFGVRDRVYIVTGASRGLGRAVAEVLVAEGAYVIISARNEHGVQRAASALGTARAVGVAANNAEAGSAERLVATAMAKWGRLDGALISVGGPPPGPAMDVADDQWRSAFESVFLGGIRVARSVAAACREGGSIAFVLSSSVRTPIAGLSVSNGLRPGLGMVAKTLADELGPGGIRVNGLLPGSIETDRLRELHGSGPEAETERQRAQAAIPLRRYGTPEEFGRVAAFLLSPMASYITGTMVPVDGGLIRSL